MTPSLPRCRGAPVARPFLNNAENLDLRVSVMSTQAAHENRRRRAYKQLGATTNPRVWQRLGMPDHSPFFFLWGGPASPHTRYAGVSSLGSVRDDEVRSSSGAIRERANPSGVRRSNMDSILKAKKSISLAVEDDDRSLSVRQSALFDRHKRESDPCRYPESTNVPFLTISIRETFRTTGVDLGDLATVVNPRTGRLTHAIVGDGRHIPGAEPSVWISEELGLSEGESAIYLIHPGTGSGQGVIPTNSTINQCGNQLFRRPPTGSNGAWDRILGDCFWDSLSGRLILHSGPLTGRPASPVSSRPEGDPRR
ncbi:MAG: Polysaccharide deacetylase [Planctomycetota bacterium]|nr:Polysaccharide deacetylase [Planctomycetota bacterium]